MANAETEEQTRLFNQLAKEVNANVHTVQYLIDEHPDFNLMWVNPRTGERFPDKRGLEESRLTPAKTAEYRELIEARPTKTPPVKK